MKINNVNTTMFSGWEYCVSTSSSFMSLSWVEHFFSSKEEAAQFETEAHRQGYVTLTITPDEY